MKKVKKTISMLLAASMLTLSTGCFGEFALTRKLYNWNKTVVESKAVQTLLFYALTFFQVYYVAGTIDFVIFNLVEFWSGSNPISMEAGEEEVQNIAMNGVNYEVKATPNQFTVTALDGENQGMVQTLRFDEDSRTWMAATVGQAEQPIIGLEENYGEEHLAVYNAEGEIAQMIKPNKLRALGMTAMY